MVLDNYHWKPGDQSFCPKKARFCHRNNETVVNEVRQKFYIPCLRVTFRKAKKSCQRCKNKEAHPNPPQMADLPTSRLAIRFVPYSFVGIDFFGPIYVIVGRNRKEKRWGVLFTCLTIRAIHIEIASGLDTNSCILCINNFSLIMVRLSNFTAIVARILKARTTSLKANLARLIRNDCGLNSRHHIQAGFSIHQRRHTWVGVGRD